LHTNAHFPDFAYGLKAGAFRKNKFSIHIESGTNIEQAVRRLCPIFSDFPFKNGETSLKFKLKRTKF
jgi:hypothetical protein